MEYANSVVMTGFSHLFWNRKYSLSFFFSKISSFVYPFDRTVIVAVDTHRKDFGRKPAVAFFGNDHLSTIKP